MLSVVLSNSLDQVASGVKLKEIAPRSLYTCTDSLGAFGQTGQTRCPAEVIERQVSIRAAYERSGPPT